MTNMKRLAACSISCLLTGNAIASVLPEQADRLGKDLTPMGAELAGNADGSIPVWDPAGTPVPEGFVPGSDNYVNPYDNEKPGST